MTSTATTGSASGGLRTQVQRFGTFLSNMVLPNIGAFIAWGLITALFIETGWITLIGKDVFGYEGGYGFVEDLGAWGSGADGTGIVGPMITYLLPLLIGYTGGRMMYDDNIRGGVVGAIATMGAIAGASVPMFLGAMVMGPLAGWSMKRLDALWSHKIRPGFEMLVNNFSAGIWGGFLAVIGFVLAGPFVEEFSKLASNVVNTLVDNNLLPLTSIFIEPAKILFLNNAINQGILTPLGTTEAKDTGQSILFMLEANPGPGLGLLLAFAVFGKGVAKASAPGAILIQFVGGIHEIYFPYVLMKPILVLAVIAGGMSGVAVNVAFDSGLRSPASPGSIIAVWTSSPPSSLVGVTLSVVVAAAVSFLVASFLLKIDRSVDEGDLGAATAAMEANKGKKSSVAGMLTRRDADRTGPITSIVFACDAGMGSSAMGASVLRKKIQAAGHPEVTVVNKAISNLTDDYDLVVTHQDLTERARLKTGSAIHVSVENFMNSPRYDEIVQLVEESGESGGSAAAEPEASSAAASAGVGGLLSPESIVLDAGSGTREEAITRAGELLVAAGAVEPSYVDAMHEREQSVSTYMGNLLAIPHGTNEAKPAIKRSAISFVRYSDGVQWKNKEVKFVIGIAAQGDDHLKLLGQIAEVFLDSERVARLEAATSADEVQEVLGAVQPV
ncbi:PTS mannitol transporter subunit IICBA [Nocardioides sp. cx-173]|uniref:PTS mannitol transporter subunit IICBA n=1 Tax=Nocardioides sp. cx-173 TaxID=2898796 RepID=UPI001E57E0A4|nr:PTS mannitol transporter subunit IICBA [Nocardioides sp. cx-173]MCD4524904.1 PTS mannitol transporter subunit IICBA [Nocardioides sp. cx-173]UGB43406.1 PTS mannitol transporter subunit IICBA [Nocardioides sp. cx-173]